MKQFWSLKSQWYEHYLEIDFKSWYLLKSTSKLLQNLQVLWQYLRVLHLQVHIFLKYCIEIILVTLLASIRQVNTLQNCFHFQFLYLWTYLEECRLIEFWPWSNNQCLMGHFKITFRNLFNHMSAFAKVESCVLITQ